MGVNAVKSKGFDSSKSEWCINTKQQLSLLNLSDDLWHLYLPVARGTPWSTNLKFQRLALANSRNSAEKNPKFYIVLRLTRSVFYVRFSCCK